MLSVHRIEKLTVAVISYNVSDKLRRCLESVHTHLPGCMIIVWDNASDDNSAEMVRDEFTSVELHVSPDNLFFPEGCNQLIELCHTPFILLMNADVWLENSCVLELVEYVENSPEIAAVSPAVEDAVQIRHMAHSAVTPSIAVARDAFPGKILRRTDWYRRMMFQHKEPYEIFDVPKITNSCCVLNRAIYRELGGFSTEQFLYWTEEDFAIKVAQAGYRQTVFGSCRVHHEHGSSSRKQPPGLIRAITVRDRFVYMKHHFGVMKAVLVDLAVIFRPKLWRSFKDLLCLIRYLPEMRRINRRIEIFQDRRISSRIHS